MVHRSTLYKRNRSWYSCVKTYLKWKAWEKNVISVISGIHYEREDI